MNREGFLSFAAGVYHASRSVMRAVPEGKLDWAPRPDMMNVGQVLEHLTNACAGAIKMVAEGNFPPLGPNTPTMMAAAKDMAAAASVGAAMAKLGADEMLLREVVMGWSEEEFQTKQIQAPWLPFPLPAWQFCLDMADHLSEHKMQLFQYLRILGEPVNTWTLYGAEAPKKD